MNISINEILTYDICQEWDTNRIEKFMNTPPYQNPGCKSIDDFIHSIGIEGITESEIFWLFIQKLSINQRFDFCIDYISHLFYSEPSKFNSEFNHIFKSYLNQTKIVDQFLADIKTDELNIIETKDYCDESRLLYQLHNLHYEYSYKKTDLLHLTRSFVNNINIIYQKDICYTLNFLTYLYD